MYARKGQSENIIYEKKSTYKPQKAGSQPSPSSERFPLFRDLIQDNFIYWQIRGHFRDSLPSGSFHR